MLQNGGKSVYLGALGRLPILIDISFKAFGNLFTKFAVVKRKSMRKLIRLALILIVAVLVYNYYLGSDEEKATSEKVFNQVKEVGKSIGELIAKEKQKFAEGKYDRAFEKIADLYEEAKEKLGSNQDDQRSFEELEKKKDALEKEKAKLEEELAKEEPDEEVIKRNETLDEELETLGKDFGALLKKIMSREKE